LFLRLAAQARREVEVRAREVEARIDAAELTRRDGAEPWQQLSDTTTLQQGDERVFLLGASPRLLNISPNLARVAFPQASSDEYSVKSGQELVIEPGGERIVTWSRAALRTPEDLGQDRTYSMRDEVWVRDLGINMRDTFAFNLYFAGYFERDGSRLIVRPTLSFQSK
jgi:hypothetical protein